MHTTAHNAVNMALLLVPWTHAAASANATTAIIATDIKSCCDFDVVTGDIHSCVVAGISVLVSTRRFSDPAWQIPAPTDGVTEALASCGDVDIMPGAVDPFHAVDVLATTTGRDSSDLGSPTAELADAVGLGAAALGRRCLCSVLSLAGDSAVLG